MIECLDSLKGERDISIKQIKAMLSGGKMAFGCTPALIKGLSYGRAFHSLIDLGKKLFP